MAEKVKVEIVVEVLHIDAAPSMIAKAEQQIRVEFEHGSLKSSDGDSVTWKTTRTPVEF